MSADVSKVRFDPLLNHSGIGCQQGRVWLDADINEYIAITDRRLRAHVADLQPTRTAVSRLTPDAFKITLADGVMSIGAGRMYVDGVLAENHGTANEFDAVLAERNGTDAIAYTAQRQHYWPTPGELPAAGSHLVYLDVWERELTALNCPDLVECAIGVDTTTRSQTVWQVRLMEAPAGAGCNDAIQQWNDQIAPSSARLSTSTTAVVDPTDPCVIPPGGGYRGLENQLYRVELHSPTEYKWSRDNATVGSAVTQVVSTTELRLQTLGRDEVLRINNGDWVEITDDARELSRRSGEMRQIDSTKEDSATILFTSPLPADLATSTHHLRVRKWDAPATPIPAAGTKTDLEHGVQIEFTFSPTGTPRVGDYWVFAARSAAPSPHDSLEKLTAAPPRGIHHHYARLAMITLPGAVTDCRPGWDFPDGEAGCVCQICLDPEQHRDGTFTLRDAVDKLGRRGGTITLCPGVYDLADPLSLGGASSVRIRGCGANSEVHAGGTAIVLEDCRDIVLEDFAVSTHTDAPTILFAERTDSCRLSRLQVNGIEGGAIHMRGVHVLPEISRCRITAPTDGVTIADHDDLITHGLTLRDNTFECDRRGIDLGVERGTMVIHDGTTVIAGNTVNDATEYAIRATGLVTPPGDLRLQRSLEVRGNTIVGRGTGIVTGPNARITDNTITATGDRMRGQRGIAVEPAPPDTHGDAVHVLANVISGVGGDAIISTAPIRALTIAHNTVQASSGGITVTAPGSDPTVTITDNEILDLKPAPHDFPLAIGVAGAPPRMRGIIVTGGADVTISGNTIDGIAANEQDSAQTLVGIAARGCREALITANTVSRIGHPGNIDGAIGIAAAAWRYSVIVAHNNVISGRGEGREVPGHWIAVKLSSEDDPDLDVAGAQLPAGKLVVMPGLMFVRPEALGHAQLSDNSINGGGRGPALVVTIEGELLMTGNRCAQPMPEDRTVAVLEARVALVQGNRFFGGDPSATLDVAAEPMVIGNIATGGIMTPAGDVVNIPPTSFNINA